MSPYRAAVRRFKREYLAGHLRLHDGCRTKTAKAIGLNRTLLQRFIKDLGITVPVESGKVSRLVLACLLAMGLSACGPTTRDGKLSVKQAEPVRAPAVVEK